MPEFSVYKASAGSGKTFQLTRHYLEFLFRDEKNYSAILAVTFTNKAASELKERVLQELIKISEGRVQESAHFEYLSSVLNRDASILVPRARRILVAILKDYSHFSIGTIDEFFQSVLRSFARELGVYSGYTIELSPGPIIHQAIKNLIDKAASQPELFQWMLDGIAEKIEQGAAWRRFEQELLDLGKELLKENISVLIVHHDENLFSTKKIKAFRKKLTQLETDFVTEMKEISDETIRVLEQTGLEASDFKGRRNSAPSYLIRLKDGNYDPKTKRNWIDNPEEWLTKTTKDSIRIPADRLINGSLNNLLIRSVGLYDSQFHIVNLALKIRKKLIRLGMTSALSSEIISTSQDKGAFLISFTNPLIASLVNDNPAPFIYERTGRYYSNYMIDEFQDTSSLQWNNFLPLIRESLSNGGNALLVGDAKQSIYRWRTSNWKLIASRAEDDLKPFSARNIDLTRNFRSRKSVIDFNNQFFNGAAEVLINHLKEGIGDRLDLVADDLSAVEELYNKVSQEFGNSKDGGFVQVQFLDEEENGDFPSHFPKIYNQIVELQSELGYAANDIVFLVRNKKEATRLIQFFDSEAKKKIEQPCNMRVVSGESLRLDTSPVIRAIIACLKLLDDPINHSLLGRLALEIIYCKDDAQNWTGILAIAQKSKDEMLKVIGITNYDRFVEKLEGLPVNEQIELFIKELSLAEYEGAVSMIYSFKEHVYSAFGYESGYSRAALIEWWEEDGGSQKVPMDDQIDAMRILTIHKAKGLEFKVVFIPDCSWELDHSPSHKQELWLKTEGTPFSDLPILPILYERDLLHTPFAKEYAQEMVQIFLDNFNLLYVALTRAMDRMHIYVPTPGTRKRFNVGELLMEVTKPDQQTGIYEFGDAYTSQNLSKAKSDQLILYNEYPQSDDLKFLTSNAFSSPELKRGRKIHQILERMKTRSDLDLLLEEMIHEGMIQSEESRELKDKVISIISREEIESLFMPGCDFHNEKSFMLPGVGELRADRIVFSADKVSLIEYKTGQSNPAHKSQVKKYIKGLRDMGYQDIEAFILYIDQNEIISV